ncbi:MULTISPECIES: aldo/keto reductase [Clostridia]|uniref:aldo/keto reductase n=1 Tax=Clostridia TaxID=186801 RepID=UPI0015FBB690|nr:MULTISPECIES: aldo/keto reductase [Clostridia]
MDKVPVVKLANGVEIPQLGIGMMNAHTQEEMDAAVSSALEAGYTSFDSAYCYKNEKELGISLQKYAKSRQDIFLTSKSRTLRHAYQDAIDTVYQQLEDLQTNYLDLYLIHWPLPVKPALYLEAWKACEKLYKDGIIRAIGVSNFFVRHFQKIMEECKIIPMVNQIQCQPYYENLEVTDFCRENGIAVESWQPLGGGVLLQDEKIAAIAHTRGKSPAQIILRWQIQKGFIAIPGSVKPEHIKQNIDIFDFELTEGEMDTINKMECQRPILLPIVDEYNPDDFPILW